MFLLVPAHPGSPRRRAVKQLLLLLLFVVYMSTGVSRNPVKNWGIPLEQSFTAHMPLLTTTHAVVEKMPEFSSVIL